MTAITRRLSPQTIAVLEVLNITPRAWRYGLEIAAETGLKSGSLYPILVRLHDRGLLESQWLEPERPGRPARHAYRMTGAGKAALRDAAARTVGLTTLSTQGAG
jgi:PadR family transcriptional regulator PadR